MGDIGDSWRWNGAMKSENRSSIHALFGFPCRKPTVTWTFVCGHDLVSSDRKVTYHHDPMVIECY